MRLYIGNTDLGWNKYLSQENPEDINFWQPGGNTNFKVLAPGGPFLFRLKSPINKIAGVGFFARHTRLPLNMAWQVFGNRNGTETFDELQDLIIRYRAEKQSDNPSIGCI